jgi:hypothetical protein
MIALLCFFLILLTSPFKSKSRLEAENAALRHQVIVLQRSSIPDKPIAPGSPWQNVCVPKIRFCNIGDEGRQGQAVM